MKRTVLLNNLKLCVGPNVHKVEVDKESKALRFLYNGEGPLNFNRIGNATTRGDAWLEFDNKPGEVPPIRTVLDPGDFKPGDMVYMCGSAEPVQLLQYVEKLKVYVLLDFKAGYIDCVRHAREIRKEPWGLPE